MRDGQSEDWQRLFDWFSPRVYQWCRHCRLQPADAAEVVQEVLVSVALHMDEFHRSRPGDSFRGWLWTIAQNKIRDHFRRRANRPEAFGGTDAQQRIQQEPEPDLLSRVEEPSVEDSRRLVAQRAMDSLRGAFDEKTWEAFRRMTMEGHCSAEIAEDLGMTKEAVRQAKCRVLRRLRSELEGLC